MVFDESDFAKPVLSLSKQKARHLPVLPGSGTIVWENSNLNNIIEQDHSTIKQMTKPMLATNRNVRFLLRWETAVSDSRPPFSISLREAKLRVGFAIFFLYMSLAIVFCQLAWTVKYSQRAVLITIYAHFGFDLVTAMLVAGYL